MDQEHKKHFTLVLKGHIALATAVFPQGTTGTQLDILAHQFLWHEHKNYGHGTGHGIGHFLCVHEGPQRISTAPSSTALVPGMFISNEPGFYPAGRYGIRLENMTCVREASQNEFGKFFELETMSFFPFDRAAIEVEALSPAEVEWINNYHKETFRKITATGKLTPKETEWLAQLTAPLQP